MADLLKPADTPVIYKAAIPAAGLGTRLRPLTLAFPKELLPIGRRPVLAHIATELRCAGITEALFIVSEKKPQIRSYFGDVYEGDEFTSPDEKLLPPLVCRYVVQQSQRGLGDALLHAEEWAAEAPFAVAFGDCMIAAPDPSAPLRRMLDHYRRLDASAAVLVQPVPQHRVSRYGIVAPDADAAGPFEHPFLAQDIVEKPRQEEAPSNLAVAARWVLGPSIFGYLRTTELDSRGELNLTDPVRRMRRDGGRLCAVPLLPGETRQDIGNFETYFAASVGAALNDPEFGESVRRLVTMDPGSRAARPE